MTKGWKTTSVGIRLPDSVVEGLSEMAVEYKSSRTEIARMVLVELVRRYYGGSKYFIEERNTVTGRKRWSCLSLDAVCHCGSGKKVGECCGGEANYSIEKELRGLMGNKVPRLVEGKHVVEDGEVYMVEDGDLHISKPVGVQVALTPVNKPVGLVSSPSKEKYLGRPGDRYPGTARGAPCPCGSRKKYKRCCGKRAPFKEL